MDPEKENRRIRLMRINNQIRGFSSLQIAAAMVLLEERMQNLVNGVLAMETEDAKALLESDKKIEEKWSKH